MSWACPSLRDAFPGRIQLIFGLWEQPVGTPWSWWKLWLRFVTPSKPDLRGVYHIQADWAAQGHILLCTEQQSPTAASHQWKKLLPPQLFHYFFIIFFFPNLHLLRSFCNTGAQHPNILHWLKTSGLRGCHLIPQKEKKQTGGKCRFLILKKEGSSIPTWKSTFYLRKSRINWNTKGCK